MESLIFRTGSGSIPLQSPLPPASPRHSVSLSAAAAGGGVFSGEKNGTPPPRISLNMEISRRSIRRSYSEPDVARSEFRALSKLGSRSFTALPEVDRHDGSTELGFPGGGMNKNRNSGGGGGGGGNGSGGGDDDRHKMGEYYEEMLKSDPRNSLLLGNYAKYLHQVEKDVVKAEEYYGRAILANPGECDGEVLSMYGKLIWDIHRDENRAIFYFNQALLASPHNCMIMGSYAHFMWEVEEEEEKEIGRSVNNNSIASSIMVEAF
ncbi:hypothetical protein ABFS83_05G072600 [Erythranthe nasuta]